jgi:hypothetical protein
LRTAISQDVQDGPGKGSQPMGYFIKPVNIDEVIDRIKTFGVEQVEG